MRKGKQILALIGVILLVGLYAATIFCALAATDNFMNLLMASVGATILIPVLIWLYTVLAEKIKKNRRK